MQRRELDGFGLARDCFQVFLRRTIQSHKAIMPAQIPPTQPLSADPMNKDTLSLAGTILAKSVEKTISIIKGESVPEAWVDFGYYTNDRHLFAAYATFSSSRMENAVEISFVLNIGPRYDVIYVDADLSKEDGFIIKQFFDYKIENEEFTSRKLLEIANDLGAKCEESVHLIRHEFTGL